MSATRVAGLPAHQTAGPDAPWVLLHGFGQTAEAWAPVLAALPRPVATVALTLPGHAEAPPVGPDFDAVVDQLAAALAALSPGPLPVMGYSLGGRLALGLVVRHPARVARAVVVGAHPGLEDASARAQRAEDDEVWAQRLSAEGPAAFFAAWTAQPLFASQARLSPARLAPRQAARQAHAPEPLAEALRRLSLARMPTWTGALAHSPIPLTYVVGAEDAKFMAVAAALQRARPDLALRIVPGVGHDVGLEAPEVLAALLAEGSGA
jgi:2-succinyl-6-hydroxy-2,4-cyclohexadiene-1-carboxylate synthase